MYYIKKILEDENGLELSEYAVAAALITAAILAAFIAVGNAVATRISAAAAAISQAS